MRAPKVAATPATHLVPNGESVLPTAVKDIRLLASDNSSEATEWSRELMRTQYEWLFINMIVTTKNATDLEGQDIIVYTVRRAGWLQVNIWRSKLSRDIHLFQITMKRRPLLYIVNFLLPVLFFLCLDLSSFLISDKGGEKLSFKVTVLLAVTVLQLILNEILPSSSNRIPLIGQFRPASGLLFTPSCTLPLFPLSLSPLLHRELCSDAPEPSGNHFSDAPVGEG